VFEEKDKKDFLFFVFLGDFFFSSPQHESLFRLCFGVSQTRISIFVCVCFARVSALTHTNLYFVCVCFVVGVRGEKKKTPKKNKNKPKKHFFVDIPQNTPFSLPLVFFLLLFSKVVCFCFFSLTLGLLINCLPSCLSTGGELGLFLGFFLFYKEREKLTEDLYLVLVVFCFKVEFCVFLVCFC